MTLPHPAAAPPDLADPALAARAAAGDHAAFELLMRRHNRALYRTARAVLRDDAEAEDVLQDAYLQAYRQLPSFRGDAALSTWLTRIVVHAASARLRTTRRRASIVPIGPAGAHPDQEAAMAPDAEQHQPEPTAVRAQARRLIEAQIDALPASYRTVFMLRAVEELSVAETAHALDLPEATVRSRYFRARGLLREALAREFDQALESAFAFDGARCDRIVATVLSSLDPTTKGEPPCRS
jgi:RNA polymerase sigma-70 factor (ECF subfamily)